MSVFDLLDANVASPCDYCGRVGEYKASAWRTDLGKRFYCHNNTRSCYNEARGRYFEECSCDKDFHKPVSEAHYGWTLTRRDPECKLHRNRVVI